MGEQINLGRVVGRDGKSLRVTPNGNYGHWDEATQTYVDSGVPANVSVDVEDVEVSFNVNPELKNIETGDKIPEVFSVLAKWYVDIISKVKALAYKDKVDYTEDIINKPSIPSSTADLTNTANFQTGIQVNTAIQGHNTNAAAHTDMRSEIAAVRMLAEGAQMGYSFETIAKMNAWLSVQENKDKLKINNLLLIEQLDVPDFWWNGTQALELEAAKVDLSDYAKIAALALKADKSILKSVTLLASEWQDNTAMSGYYLQIVSDAGILETSIIQHTPATLVDRQIGQDAGIQDYSELSAGQFVVYSKSIPVADVSINYIIQQ